MELSFQAVDVSLSSPTKEENLLSSRARRPKKTCSHSLVDLDSLPKSVITKQRIYYLYDDAANGAVRGGRQRLTIPPWQ